MNNEYENNQSGEYTNSNQQPNSNPDSYEKQNEQHSEQNNEQQSFDNSYYTVNFRTGDANQSTSQTNDNFPTVYPVPQMQEEKKPKKKRKIFSAFKLAAAAIAFGLIAGIVFQGYTAITFPKTTQSGEVSDNNLQIAEVTQDTGKDGNVVTTDASTDTVVTDVSDVVANVMPSIVAINSTATATSYDFFGREYSQESQGSGSGIIIGQNDDKILIVTNNHVIQDATAIEVVFADETTATGVVKGSDSNADLAIVTVDASALSAETTAAIKVATIGDSDQVKAGDMAIAIGNALGYGQSVTVGYISAVDREVTIEEQTMTLLQTDAAINPGNSGGALLNSKGEVIGINSVKFASEEVEGMGYAIPISSAIPMINELINREVVSESEQGFLGIDASTAQNVTELYAQRFNMPIGVYVNDVVEASPAETAGLMQGDIITGIDNITIETIDDLKNALSYKKAGDTISLIIQVKENGEYVEKTLSITLAEKD